MFVTNKQTIWDSCSWWKLYKTSWTYNHFFNDTSPFYQDLPISNILINDMSVYLMFILNKIENRMIKKSFFDQINIMFGPMW